MFNTIQRLYEQTQDEMIVINAFEKHWIDSDAVENILGKTIDDVNLFEYAQERKQDENKKALARFLRNHPITWVDGCKYGVTEEDQNELALNLNQYQLQIASGISDVTLEWHPYHSECRNFTLEEYTTLILAIKNFVYPYVQHCQEIKAQIYNAKTMDELEMVEIVYEKAE